MPEEQEQQNPASNPVSMQEQIIDALVPALEALAADSRLAKDEIVEAIKNITIQVPEQEPIEVNIPDIELPEIRVPEAKVSVSIPPIKVPPAQITMPDSMMVSGEVGLRGVDQRNPLPVILTDSEGRPYTAAFMGGGGGGKHNFNTIKDLLTPKGDSMVDDDTDALRVSTVASGSSTSSTNVVQIAGTDVAANSGVTNAGTLRVVNVVDVGTSANVTHVGGTAVSVGSGTSDSGTQRVILPTDLQTLNIQQVSGANDSVNIVSTVTLDVKQVSGSVDSMNVLQLGGTAVDVNVGTAGAGTLRTVIGTDSTVMTVGDIPSDVADTGVAPVKVGGIARTANPTAVAAGDRVSATFDDVGRQINYPYQVRDLIATAQATLTNGTETTLLAGASGVFHDLVYIACSNSSSGTVTVDIRDATAGGVVMTIDVPANATAGVSTPVPVPQNAAADTWTADMGDVTNTTVKINGLFIKNV